MDSELLLQIIVGLLAMLLTIIGFTVRAHKESHDNLKDSHNALALEVSKNYASKLDLNSARIEATDSIRRLHDKIEAAEDNLDKKISEIPDRVMRLMNRTI